MNKLLFSLMAVLISFGSYPAFAQAKKKADQNTQEWRYDIEYGKTGANGMVMVKVWSYSKKAHVAIEQCKKNAVHGVIFKGYTSDTGNISQKALSKTANIAAEQEDFFRSFFADGGQYMKYVSAVADGNMEVRKVGKEYKVGTVVSVNKDQLRKDLEDAGMIKGLTTGF